MGFRRRPGLPNRLGLFRLLLRWPKVGQDAENMRYFCEDEAGIYLLAGRNCFSTTSFGNPGCCQSIIKVASGNDQNGLTTPDGREEMATEYLCDSPGCPNIAAQMRGGVATTDFMRAASIVGFILVALGLASLLYCVSPILLLVHAAEQRQTNPVLPILGGLALVCGIALLFASRPRS